MARVMAGIMASVIALVCFVAHLIVRDNIRFNRTPFSEGTLELADFLIIPGAWLAYYSAVTFFARSGITVMRSDTRRPVLYLRSFRADASFWAGASSTEHQLTRALSGLGPVVAIGAPGRAVPPLGAARLNVTDEHWQEVVKELVANAQLIVLRIGTTEGFWWELEHLVGTADPRKVIVFLPPKDRGGIYRDFRERVHGMLPPFPELPKGAMFIAFSSDWVPRLLAADGPSPSLRLRRWLGSGEAPALRAALGEAVAIKPMPLGFKEWGAILFAVSFAGSLLMALTR